ncbi:MAG: hypothetical protein ABFD63_09860 [Smithella sp.]
MKMLDIDSDFLKAASNEAFMDELRQEIERKLDKLDEKEMLPHCKRDVIQLISGIEKAKIRFLQGHIRVQQLYREVDANLSMFKKQYPKFDYLNDPVVNAYYA